jgi:cyanophycin synthetase
MSELLDVSARATQPFFRLAQEWRPLAGFGFGLREPGIVVGVDVCLPDPVDFIALDASMAEAIPEKLPEEEADAGDSLRLVRRAAFWTGALQRQTTIPVFGRANVDGPFPSGQGEAFQIALPVFAPAAAMMALGWVSAAINHFLLARYGSPSGEARQSFGEIAEALREHRPPGINLYRILLAAHVLGIPAKPFADGVFCLGTGAKRRWLKSSFTDRTSMLGARIAGNKLLTADLLRRAGLPGATHAEAKSEAEAVAIARRLGYPVVVKPGDGRQGVGVAANLETDEAVAGAYRDAARASGMILVEKHFEGNDFRLVVVDGKLLGGVARLPGGVVGDGQHTLLELIELENRDPTRMRRAREGRAGVRLSFDDEARALVAEAGMAPDSVPDRDAFVRLRRRANISAGGSGRILNLDEIHPDNRRLVEAAACVLRLDIAGVDLLIPDISKSWLEVGALICEVNAQPQIASRSTQPLIEYLFGGGSKIPVVLVVGPVAEVDWQAMQQALACDRAGYSSTSGVWLGADRIALAQENGFVAGQVLLDHQDADAALIHLTPRDVVHLGLPCDSCDALVIAAPDLWSGPERNLLPRIIDIAAPHARRIIHTPPSQSFWAEFGARNIRAAGETPLDALCATELSTALAAGRASPA